MTLILYIGGARSGKSRLAEARALSLSAAPVYVATAQAGDGEMAERIALHRVARGAGWSVVEEPLDLVGALTASDGGPARLVDCLTLWLSNLMEAEREIGAETAALIDTLARQDAPVVLVTNEVGQGIVPDNALARAYRDAAGRLNQAVAEVADEVVLATAGLGLKLKG